MPFYEYQCGQCGESFVALRQMQDRDEPYPCPECGSEEVGRKVSAFATAGGGAEPGCPSADSCGAGFG